MNKNNTDTGRIIKNTSFIMTVLNEETSIKGFLDSLFAQTVMPSEIVIIDGGSKDKTPEFVAGYFKNIAIQGQADGQKWPGDVFKLKGNAGKENISGPNIIRLFKGISGKGVRLEAYIVPQASISKGRNTAIDIASGSFLCVSDAGCRLDAGWLSEITKSFDDTNAPSEVVGGITLPFAQNFTQACLAVCMLPLDSEINEEKFMPSSRNAGFLKSAWKMAGKYPEYMDYGEDMKFNFNLKKAGYKIKFNSCAKVYWNLRDNPAAVFKQFFRYAKGDAIGRMYYKRHIIRIVSLLIMAAAITLSVALSPYFIFLAVFLLVAYSYRPYLRINHFTKDKKICPFVFGNGKKNRLLIAAIAVSVPFMLFYIDTAKLSGYFYGLFKRKIHKV
ncbi:MAG: glycosyltransferase [Actinobacteria bacterium]|nr:glycosyltransferase [Actinomycetota bacterium]